MHVFAKTCSALALAGLAAGIAPAVAETAGIDPARVEAAVARAWPDLPIDLAARVRQDPTQAACSLYRDQPPDEVAEEILARERASIVYPADGQLLGDWQVGLQEANNGYGLRMRDDPSRVVGGNCYACHQLDPAEVAYGTLGPSLTGYGRNGDLSPERVRAVYEKIYNSQSVLPCSNMPRFGANKFLTPEQIRDYVALLLHPDSPVNK